MKLLNKSKNEFPISMQFSRIMRDLRHVTKNQIFQVSEVMAFEKMSRDEAGKEFKNDKMVSTGK